MGTGGDFVSNYLLNGSPLGTNPYLTALTTGVGSTQGGDLNAQYSQMYFSITQLKNMTTNVGVCPIEMVLFGAFPDARYLSASVYDMHYDIAQHVTDASMDPISTAGGTEANPFRSGTSYQPNDYYLVPVGLGTVPNQQNINSACGVTPSETDNLLDATQRHLSVDWNTDYWYSQYIGSTSGAHTVDSPSHSNPNLAGAAIVRFYQPVDPPCTTVSNCPPIPPASVPPVYAAFRDASTGCPITIKSISNLGTTTNQIVYVGTDPGTAAAYAFSGVDPSPATNWLDTKAEAGHSNYSNATPDSCYSDQSAATPPNAVAWTRSPEWVFLPAPDDAYIGGAISATDLKTLAGSSCPTGGAGLCLILLQFQLPSMPNTPCAPVGSNYPCQLTGSEQLRYMSLSLGFNPGSTASDLDLDGMNPTASGPVSLVSLSDAAFATTASGGYNYVNLLVNVNPSGSNAFQAFLNGKNASGAFQGVYPRNNATANSPGTNFTALQFQLGNPKISAVNYTAVDLTLLPGFSTWYTAGNASPFSAALLLNIRNTLPASAFTQSGLAVPFSTAQYLGGNQGIMGPYVPLVSYVVLSNLSTSLPTNLPSAGQPTSSPLTNKGEIVVPGMPLQLQNYPEQYWPSTGMTSSQYLVCGTTTPSPKINFVGTQFSIPVDDPSIFPADPTNCGMPAAQNMCSQIFAQSIQASGNVNQNWQPGLPLTIEGSGFGTLPAPNLPYATTGWSSSATAYLTVTDLNSSSQVNWSSPSYNPNGYSCQMYILKWSDTSITVVPNIQLSPTNGESNTISLITETNPFSLLASTSCPVTAGDSITVTVINPQNPTATPATINIPVNSFAGSLN